MFGDDLFDIEFTGKSFFFLLYIREYFTGVMFLVYLAYFVNCKRKKILIYFYFEIIINFNINRHLKQIFS